MLFGLAMISFLIRWTVNFAEIECIEYLSNLDALFDPIPQGPANQVSLLKPWKIKWLCYWNYQQEIFFSSTIIIENAEPIVLTLLDVIIWTYVNGKSATDAGSCYLYASITGIQNDETTNSGSLYCWKVFKLSNYLLFRNVFYLFQLKMKYRTHVITTRSWILPALE